MTWGEIQIESLKKMFLNNDDLSIDELEMYKDDKKYKTYLFAMPQACNEAINYICNLEPIIKSYELNVESSERYNLKDLISDFKHLDSIVGDKLFSWEMETNDILKITKQAGTVIIYYEAYPKLINSKTDNMEKIEINRDCLRYIPLYVAGELYKDDDLTLSTMYMNEFMNNITAITSRVKNIVNNKIIPVYTMN